MGNVSPPEITKFTRYPKIIFYGLPGLGKSTLASEMPSPVFIPTTDGLEGLAVQAFPVAKTAQQVRDYIQWLRTEPHDFKTVIVDTLGWLEKLVHDEVCAALNLEFMTQASMKSYPLAGLKLREIKDSLDELNRERKMFVALIGHATVAKFEDPTTASYDRYQLQMNDKVAEMFMQDADVVGFMNQKVQIREEKEGFSKTNKATTNGRYLFFDPCPSYYAKCHGYGLPVELRIDEGKAWAAIWEFMKVKFNGQSAKNKSRTEPSTVAGAAATESNRNVEERSNDIPSGGKLAGVAAEQKKRRTEKAAKEAAELEQAKANVANDPLPAGYEAGS